MKARQLLVPMTPRRGWDAWQNSAPPALPFAPVHLLQAHGVGGTATGADEVGEASNAAVECGNSRRSSDIEMLFGLAKILFQRHVNKKTLDFWMY